MNRVLKNKPNTTLHSVTCVISCDTNKDPTNATNLRLPFHAVHDYMLFSTATRHATHEKKQPTHAYHT